MGLLVFFFIWYVCWGQRNPRIYRSIEDKLGKLIGAVVVISVATSLIPDLLYLTIGLAVLAVIFLGPFFAIGWILKNIFGIGKKKKREKDSYVKYESPVTLTKSVPKRRKIVGKFNNKYDLGLSDTEIARIVDASYFSPEWEREVQAMSLEYASIYQWYKGVTGWLRAYFKVFPVESVSSDFGMQRQICLDSFNQVFREVNPGSFSSVDECVDYINKKYFTSFDETTFMIAYRFLQSSGMKYDMPNSGIIRNDSDIDRLRDKYDREVQQGTYTDFNKLKI